MNAEMQQRCEDWRKVREFKECVRQLKALNVPPSTEDCAIACEVVHCAWIVAVGFSCSADTAEAFVEDNFGEGKPFGDYLTIACLRDLCARLRTEAEARQPMPRSPGLQPQREAGSPTTVRECHIK